MTDAWEEATYSGKALAQGRRVAGLTPQQRLAWLEDALIEAARTGLLTRVRERRQRDVIEAWERGTRQ